MFSACLTLFTCPGLKLDSVLYQISEKFDPVLNDWARKCILTEITRISIFNQVLQESWTESCWIRRIFPCCDALVGRGDEGDYEIQLLESPIPASAAAPAVSQKASSDDIEGTKRGRIDPLVSKQPEKILNKKVKKKERKKEKKW